MQGSNFIFLHPLYAVSDYPQSNFPLHSVQKLFCIRIQTQFWLLGAKSMYQRRQECFGKTQGLQNPVEDLAGIAFMPPYLQAGFIKELFFYVQMFGSVSCRGFKTTDHKLTVRVKCIVKVTNYRNTHNHSDLSSEKCFRHSGP